MTGNQHDSDNTLNVSKDEGDADMRKMLCGVRIALMCSKKVVLFILGICISAFIILNYLRGNSSQIHQHVDGDRDDGHTTNEVKITHHGVNHYDNSTHNSPGHKTTKTVYIHEQEPGQNNNSIISFHSNTITQAFSSGEIFSATRINGTSSHNYSSHVTYMGLADMLSQMANPDYKFINYSLGVTEEDIERFEMVGTHELSHNWP